MTAALILSWALCAFTVANIWLVGSKRREGFLVGLAAQPVWLVFDLWTGAYGLMPLALVLGFLYVRGWRAWGAAPSSEERQA